MEARAAEKGVVEAKVACDADDSMENWCTMHLAKARLKKRLEIEEAFWKQKANINGISMGTKIIKSSPLALLAGEKTDYPEHSEAGRQHHFQPR